MWLRQLEEGNKQARDAAAPVINLRSLILGVLIFIPGMTSAHICLDARITVDTLSPGVSRETICYDSLNICLRDTFYQQTLFDEVLELYQESEYVTTGKMNSFTEDGYMDTIVVNDTLEILLPYERQTLDVTFFKDIKGEKPVTDLTLAHAWVEVPLDSVTYLPAMDTTFITFYTQYDSVVDFRWGPTVDCMFEASIYFIIDNGIVKRGKGRQPGISVPLEEFCTAVDIPPLDCPSEKKPSYYFRHKDRRWLIPGQPYSRSDVVSLKIYSITGKLIGLQQYSIDQPEHGFPEFNTGNYLLKAGNGASLIGIP